jgi:hypothetical protein
MRFSAPINLAAALASRDMDPVNRDSGRGIEQPHYAAEIVHLSDFCTLCSNLKPVFACFRLVRHFLVLGC